jgi:hypothetical protein
MPLHRFLALVCKETEKRKPAFESIQGRSSSQIESYDFEPETPTWMKGFIR